MPTSQERKTAEHAIAGVINTADHVGLLFKDIDAGRDPWLILARQIQRFGRTVESHARIEAED